jgi:hypothetical protein
VRVLEACNERDLSPVQFLLEGLLPPGETFKSYQAALSHVSYHFRCLEKAGCIELVDSQQRRGATEHIYRGTAKVFFTDEEFARLPMSERRTLSRTTFQGLAARVDSAMEHDTFDKQDDRHLTWTPALLDRQGWNEMMAAMTQCYEQVVEITVESGLRLQESGEEAIPATFGMVGFESPPAPPPGLRKAVDARRRASG